MFWLFLGLCVVVFWIAWTFHLHAQEVRVAIASARTYAKGLHQYFSPGNPVGRNVQKTVQVDYKEGIPQPDTWDDDFDKTQFRDKPHP